MNTIKAVIIFLVSPLRWISGFFEEGATQSSTRLAALAYVAASIKYSMRVTPAPDPYVLGTLVATAAAFCGIKLMKDVQMAKLEQPTAPEASP